MDHDDTVSTPSADDRGCIVSTSSHLPYGGDEAESSAELGCGQPIQEQYRFTGKEAERSLGIQYFGARFYNPALSSWLSSDKATLFSGNGDPEPYRYSRNSPLGHLDPDGNTTVQALVEKAERAAVAGAALAEASRASAVANRALAMAVCLHYQRSPEGRAEAARISKGMEAISSLMKALDSGTPTFRQEYSDDFEQGKAELSSRFQNDYRMEAAKPVYKLYAHAVKWGGGQGSAFSGLGRAAKSLWAIKAAGSAESAARGIAPSSRALGQALEAAGHIRPPSSAAHHIVAGGAEAAAPARAVLERFGIGINDAANGVFLPATRAAPNAAGAAVHSTLHTRAYYQAVNESLGQASTRAEALDVLGALRQGLLGGGL